MIDIVLEAQSNLDIDTKFYFSTIVVAIAKLESEEAFSVLTAALEILAIPDDLKLKLIEECDTIVQEVSADYYNFCRKTFASSSFESEEIPHIKRIRKMGNSKIRDVISSVAALQTPESKLWGEVLLVSHKFTDYQLRALLAKLTAPLGIGWNLHELAFEQPYRLRTFVSSNRDFVKSQFCQ